MNEIMLEDIQSQPEALGSGLNDLRARSRGIALERIKRVVLTGSGDSLIAALAVERLFREHIGDNVLVRPTLDMSRYESCGAGDLVAIISVSGEVARSIEVADRAKNQGATTVAVTAAQASTLAGTANEVLVVPQPIDRSIPHSRDYTATLLALGSLLERIAGRRFPELDAWPERTAAVLTHSFDRLSALAPATGRTWFLGAGPDRATAMYGALKFWEAAGMEAWWDDLEEFGHGSQLMARPGDRAVLIASGEGTARASEMMSGLHRMGLDTVTVGSGPDREGALRVQTWGLDGPGWHPFTSCLPLQVLTYVEAEKRSLNVSITLCGQPHGPIYDDVHIEWTRHSQISTGEDA